MKIKCESSVVFICFKELIKKGMYSIQKTSSQKAVSLDVEWLQRWMLCSVIDSFEILSVEINEVIHNKRTENNDMNCRFDIMPYLLLWSDINRSIRPSERQTLDGPILGDYIGASGDCLIYTFAPNKKLSHYTELTWLWLNQVLL